MTFLDDAVVTVTPRAPYPQEALDAAAAELARQHHGGAADPDDTELAADVLGEAMPFIRATPPDAITRIAALFAWLCEQIPPEFLENAGVPHHPADITLQDRIERWLRDGR